VTSRLSSDLAPTFLPSAIVYKNTRFSCDKGSLHFPTQRRKQPGRDELFPPGGSVLCRCIGASRRLGQIPAYQGNKTIIMTPYEQDTPIERLYRQYRVAKKSLAALQASLEEIVETHSITTGDGYVMYAPSGRRLLDTNYVKDQVVQYQVTKQRKEKLRKRLIELGEPDPEQFR
jgi:hypothetical protein